MVAQQRLHDSAQSLQGEGLAEFMPLERGSFRFTFHDQHIRIWLLQSSRRSCPMDPNMSHDDQLPADFTNELLRVYTMQTATPVRSCLCIFMSWWGGRYQVMHPGPLMRHWLHHLYCMLTCQQSCPFNCVKLWCPPQWTADGFGQGSGHMAPSPGASSC